MSYRMIHSRSFRLAKPPNSVPRPLSLHNNRLLSKYFKHHNTSFSTFSHAEILGSDVNALKIHLKTPNDTVRAEPRSLVYMTDRVEMKTKIRKEGIVGRLLTDGKIHGVEFGINNESASEDSDNHNQDLDLDEHILLAPMNGGRIVRIELGNANAGEDESTPTSNDLVCAQGSFLASSNAVEFSSTPYVVQGMATGFFGGEGFLMQKLEVNKELVVDSESEQNGNSNRQRMLVESSNQDTSKEMLNIDVVTRGKNLSQSTGAESLSVLNKPQTHSVFLRSYGHISRIHLKTSDDFIRVSRGRLLAFTPSSTIQYSIENSTPYMNQNVKDQLQSKIFGGEGFFLAHLRGPGTVWIQSGMKFIGGGLGSEVSNKGGNDSNPIRVGPHFNYIGGQGQQDSSSETMTSGPQSQSESDTVNSNTQQQIQQSNCTQTQSPESDSFSKSSDYGFTPETPSPPDIGFAPENTSSYTGGNYTNSNKSDSGQSDNSSSSSSSSSSNWKKNLGGAGALGAGGAASSAAGGKDKELKVGDTVEIVIDNNNLDKELKFDINKLKLYNGKIGKVIKVVNDNRMNKESSDTNLIKSFEIEIEIEGERRDRFGNVQKTGRMQNVIVKAPRQFLKWKESESASETDSNRIKS